jgi:hypothetical protein
MVGWGLIVQYRGFVMFFFLIKYLHDVGVSHFQKATATCPILKIIL